MKLKSVLLMLLLIASSTFLFSQNNAIVIKAKNAHGNTILAESSKKMKR